MPTTVTPRPHYDSTAVRPVWSDLPQQVRALVERRLGGAVAPAPSAGSGFTSGFAAVLRGPAGPQFVKAADSRVNSFIAEGYRREALTNRALARGRCGRPLRRWADADSPTSDVCESSLCC